MQRLLRLTLNSKNVKNIDILSEKAPNLLILEMHTPLVTHKFSNSLKFLILVDIRRATLNLAYLDALFQLTLEDSPLLTNVILSAPSHLIIRGYTRLDQRFVYKTDLTSLSYGQMQPVLFQEKSDFLIKQALMYADDNVAFKFERKCAPKYRKFLKAQHILDRIKVTEKTLTRRKTTQLQLL